GPYVSIVPLPQWMTGSVEIAGRSIPAHRVAVVTIGVATMALLHFLIEKSRYGILIRAAVEKSGIAQSIGINTGAIYITAFMAGAGLAALGGIVGAELLPVEP